MDENINTHRKLKSAVIEGSDGTINTHTQTQTVMESTEYFSNLNVHQEKPQHAVDTGEDPDPSNYPLGPGYCAHCLSLHWVADSYVPAGKEEDRTGGQTNSGC